MRVRYRPCFEVTRVLEWLPSDKTLLRRCL